MLDLDSYDVSSDVQLRFRDTDALGHVNNVVYITWMELGRMAYTDKYLPAIDWTKRGFILAGWNGDPAVEARIKEETKATIRCIPLDGEEEPGTCIKTGQPSARRVLFARAY